MKTFSLLLACFLSSLTFAQTGKIDKRSTLPLMPDFSVLNADFSARTKIYFDSLGALSVQYGKYLELTMPQDSVPLSEERLKRVNDSIAYYQGKIQTLQAFIDTELKKENGILEEKLNKTFVKYVKQFSEKMKLICVVDSPALLYGPNCKDYTEEFKLYLNSLSK